jgi:hypothetical protein
MRAAGADFARLVCMPVARPISAAALRAEAKLLTTAGLILLGLGFPATIALVAASLDPDGMSPILPLAIGAPPILLGYLACHFASSRMVKARALEGVRVTKRA